MDLLVELPLLEPDVHLERRRKLDEVFRSALFDDRASLAIYYLAALLLLVVPLLVVFKPGAQHT